MSRSVDGGDHQYLIHFRAGETLPISGKIGNKELARAEKLAGKILQLTPLQGIDARVTITKGKGVFGKRTVKIIAGGREIVSGVALPSILEGKTQEAQESLTKAVDASESLRLLKNPGRGFQWRKIDDTNYAVDYIKDGKLETDHIFWVGNTWTVKENNIGFGPDLSDVIERTYTRFRSPYFVDNLTDQEAQKLLRDDPKLGFVLRPSASQPGKIVVQARRSDGKIVPHYISLREGKWWLEGTNKANANLDQLVREAGEGFRIDPDYFPVQSTEEATKLLTNYPTMGFVCRPSANKNELWVTYKTVDGTAVLDARIGYIPSTRSWRTWDPSKREWSQQYFNRLSDLIRSDFVPFRTAAKLRMDGMIPGGQDRLMNAYFRELGHVIPDWQAQEVGFFPNVRSPQHTALSGGGKPYHANIVNLGPGGRYIAAQAPMSTDPNQLMERQETYWKMAMEQSAHQLKGLIVDLAQPTDKYITPYYPEKKGTTIEYGSVSVRLKKSERPVNDKPYIVRSEYEVKDKNTNATKTIVRLHHQGWEDFGATQPSEVNVMHSLMKREGPNLIPIVQCKAGVGRTGTLISCLALRNAVEARQTLNPQWVMLQLKFQRGPLAVQTEKQRRFVENFGSSPGIARRYY